jgi:chromosome partitioning protein
MLLAEGQVFHQPIGVPSMSSVSENDFMISLADLGSIIGISPQAIHKSVKSRNLETVLINKRAYMTPESTRAFMLSRGFTFKSLVLSLQMLKGGVAKTTSAMNIGIRANMYGARVLLIDLDQQANLSFSFGIEDPDALVWVDIVEGKASIEQAIRKVTPTLHVIPSNLNNSVLDRILLNGKRNLGSGVSQYLAPIRDRYDLIILDTAPNLSAINTAASCASDLVILPVNPDKFSFAGLTKTLDDLSKIKTEFHANFEPKILFTKFDGRETASHELLKMCMLNFGSQMVKAFIRTSTEVKNTIRTGSTIFDHKSNAKEDYDLVTRELIGMTS